MTLPAFTAESSLYRTTKSYSARLVSPRGSEQGGWPPAIVAQGRREVVLMRCIRSHSGEWECEEKTREI